MSDGWRVDVRCVYGLLKIKNELISNFLFSVLISLFLFNPSTYFVQLPDGRRQRVDYKVEGDSGFVANVTYE